MKFKHCFSASFCEKSIEEEEEREKKNDFDKRQWILLLIHQKMTTFICCEGVKKSIFLT